MKARVTNLLTFFAVRQVSRGVRLDRHEAPARPPLPDRHKACPYISGGPIPSPFISRMVECGVRPDRQDAQSVRCVTSRPRLSDSEGSL